MTAQQTQAQTSLELHGVSKHYGGVTALNKVDFQCKPASIHAILGENGAGKSTLIKIISGVVQPDEGSVKVGDQTVHFTTPQQATDHGVVCIFQELSLMPDLSVADNICITDPPRNRFGLIDHAEQIRQAEALLARVNCEDLNPRELVKNLPLSRRQMVEIAKALGRNPKILILDEATSALSASDVDKVYEILKGLREEGLTLLYISHRMHEIKELADTYSVFRNGSHIETFAKEKHTDEEIVEMMIGREISSVFPPKPEATGPKPPVMEVENLGWTDRLSNISFTLGKGEIIGLGGLDGQGQRELLLALFGVLRGVEGTVKIDGKDTHISSPKQAKSEDIGMALIPEDRKTEGLMLPMSVRDNISIVSLDQFTRGLSVDKNLEDKKIAEMVKKMAIKVGSVDDPVATLSGGNQQKVVIAKWLMTGARIILLNDPTRGIDVGTKQELYQLFRELADAGNCILYYTTDYDELIGCCDRVLIFYQGEILKELVGDQINETNIVSSSLNIDLTSQEKAAAV